MQHTIRASFFVLFTLALTSCRNPAQSNSNAINPETDNVENLPPKLQFNAGVRSIFEDRKGNYWFGSHEEGVCLFDGETFTYFTIEDGLSDNQVRTIQEDEVGNIWFGTGRGISSYNGERIINHKDETEQSLSQKTTQNWKLATTDLWFDAGISAGAYRYNGQRIEFLPFPVLANTSALDPTSVTGFSQNSPTKIWIATYSAVFGYDGTSFEIIDDELLEFTKETGQLHVRSILEDSKGNLWIGNNGIGVLLKTDDSIVNFSAENGLIHPNSSKSGDPSPKGTLEHVFAIAEDNSGNIWFGDRDTGAWKYDGKSMKNYTIDAELNSQHIWDIYQTKKGGLLFALGEGGIYKFNNEVFEKVF